MTPKELRGLAERLFSNRTTLMLLWQEQAENFYPERADFTVRRVLGTDFAAGLMTSYPIICRRELADQTGTMLRPTAKQWFHMEPKFKTQVDHNARRYLEWATGTMRRAMYDPVSKFTRAMKEGDNDFSTFGQTVLSVELNRTREHLLYRCWHLRDVVWMENQDGNICFVARRWKLAASDAVRLFRNKLDPRVLEIARKRPDEEINLMHFVCEAEMYDASAGSKPRWSVYYDCDREVQIEATAIWGRIYRIPRWQTVSGSQYAYSPATVAALPDARLLQAMTLTLLEAGEKLVNPPVLATVDVVRSDVALYAGGITWIDKEYDEKLGEALRPLTQDHRGMPLGQEMVRDTRTLIMHAFYLNKLNLPQRAAEMTAYEVGQRIQEYIRGALPLFEPMEMDYNGGICEETFEVMQRAGGFGSPHDMPESLRDTEVQFGFVSPLHDAISEQKGQKFLEMKGLTAEAIALDRNAAGVPDTIVAFRDALAGIGVPAKWVRSESEAEAMQQRADAEAETAKMLAAATASSEVAANLGAAQRDMAQAQAA